MAEDRNRFGQAIAAALMAGGDSMTGIFGQRGNTYSNYLDAQSKRQQMEYEAQKDAEARALEALKYQNTLGQQDITNQLSAQRNQLSEMNVLNTMGYKPTSLNSLQTPISGLKQGKIDRMNLLRGNIQAGPVTGNLYTPKPIQSLVPKPMMDESGNIIGYGVMTSGGYGNKTRFSVDTPDKVVARGQKLYENFKNQKEVEDYNKFIPNVQSMMELSDLAKKNPNQNMLAIDQAIITEFNKLLDPPSVVRESEYLRSTMDAPLFNRWQSAVTRIAKGGRLTQSDREALVLGAQMIADKRGEVYNKTYDQYVNQYKKSKAGEASEYIGDRYIPFSKKGVEIFEVKGKKYSIPKEKVSEFKKDMGI